MDNNPNSIQSTIIHINCQTCVELWQTIVDEPVKLHTKKYYGTPWYFIDSVIHKIAGTNSIRGSYLTRFHDHMNVEDLSFRNQVTWFTKVNPHEHKKQSKERKCTRKDSV